MSLEIRGAIAPTPSLVYRAPKVPVNALSPKRGFGPASHLRGWRTPLHWAVPPAFENRGRAMTELGIEGFKEAVRAYWQLVRESRQEDFERLYGNWIVRQVEHRFETHIREFRRLPGHDDVLTPDYLWARGRLSSDLEFIIARYQCPERLREDVQKRVVAKLRATWGVA